MEYQFADVEPKEVLHYFEEIASIPHGSGNTKQLSDHIAAFAKEHGLNCIQDRLNDLIIFKDASEGYEGCEPVILQGHMDMVAEKNSDAAIDMTKEPIRLILDPDGDTLHADGTTLGADDGIAIAMMMAVLADDTLAHPPLECIMTVDEETGLYGAAGINCSRIRGKKLLNLDSENEGVFTAGCAGGGQMECIFSGERKERRGTPVKIKVEGLLGGHSGDMINAGRANANQLLGRILIKLSKKAPFRIISVKGGNKDNAIPREAEAELLFSEDVLHKDVEDTIRGLEEAVRQEYAVTDPEIRFSYMFEEVRKVAAFRRRSSQPVLQFLGVFPYGVQECMPEDRTAPQTSLNLGILETVEGVSAGTGSVPDEVHATFLVRSNVNSQKDMLMDRLQTLTEALGGTVKVITAYPAWEYRRDSAFRDRLLDIYRKQTGRDPKVEVIHGGLECGLLSGKIEGLDAVSIGPDTQDIHTPKEKISLRSAAHLYDFVKEVLKESK